MSGWCEKHEDCDCYDTALRRAYEEEYAVAVTAQRENEELAAENARLCEQVKELEHAAGNYTPGLFDEVVAERDRLREQKDIYERYVNGEMTVSELRNAFKETT